jgi:hypothetical protein
VVRVEAHLSRQVLGLAGLCAQDHVVAVVLGACGGRDRGSTGAVQMSEALQARGLLAVQLLVCVPRITWLLLSLGPGGRYRGGTGAVQVQNRCSTGAVHEKSESGVQSAMQLLVCVSRITPLLLSLGPGGGGGGSTRAVQR